VTVIVTESTFANDPVELRFFAEIATPNPDPFTSAGDNDVPHRSLPDPYVFVPSAAYGHVVAVSACSDPTTLEPFTSFTLASRTSWLEPVLIRSTATDTPVIVDPDGIENPNPVSFR
jgi:hypothetical protein